MRGRLSTPIDLQTKAPRNFFIWHVHDQNAIDRAKGKDHMVLQNRLATMAYELCDEVDIDEETEYRYREWLEIAREDAFRRVR